MKLPKLLTNSLFQKLFVLTFLIAAIPIGLSWIYFLYVENGAFQKEEGALLPILYYSLFLLAIVLAATGAFYFSRHISRPITHFMQSATEIARGNFSQKVSVETKGEIGRLARIFNYMVTELRRLDEMNLNKIINEKNKTETILKNIADGVIVTDSTNRILMMNYVAERWFALNGGETTEQPIDAIIKNPELIDFIQDVAGNGKKPISNLEITLKPRNGWKPIVLQAKAARFKNEKNELMGIVTILRDVTREKEIDRMKTELVSMVAHELRSPLTCISGFSELLLDTNLTAEQSEEYANIILKESNRLSDLINKFLDISKIEAGKSQLRRSPVDMKMLVEKVLDFNSQLANKKNIEVKFESPPEVATVNLDRDMMEQAVLNLFSNAVKYSPSEATVTVRLKEEDSSLIVDVEDTGYGISEEALPHIFDKFYRITDNENVREVTGSGLGLSLVREIVEIHGGQIKVKSIINKGSTFTITLPKSTTESNALEQTPS